MNILKARLFSAFSAMAIMVGSIFFAAAIDANAGTKAPTGIDVTIDNIPVSHANTKAAVGIPTYKRGQTIAIKGNLYCQVNNTTRTPIQNATLYFYIDNTHIYTAKTDKKGIVSFRWKFGNTCPLGTHNMTYFYPGGGTFNSYTSPPWYFNIKK